MSFSEQFRPQNPNQLIGETQRAIAKALISKADNPVHELLFIGSSGIGKTTIARMYMMAVLGVDNLDNSMDIMEFNCSSDTGIDFIRNAILDSLPYQPMGKYKIFYLDEVHGLSRQAQNALLKDTEPLPDYVIMIMSTTEPEKIIPTLKSRFTQYHLDIPSEKEFQKLAYWITQAVKKQGKEFELDDNTRDEIISLSGGNIRSFNRLLDRVFEGSYKSFQEQAEDESSLLHAIMYGKALHQWFIAAQKEQNVAGFTRGLVNYAATVLRNPRSSNQMIKTSLKVVKHFGDLKVYQKEELYQRLSLLQEEL